MAATLMETIAEAEDADQADLGAVLILAEIKGEDEESEWTHIAFRCSDERVWVQRGLLYAALDLDREPELDS